MLDMKNLSLKKNCKQNTMQQKQIKNNNSYNIILVKCKQRSVKVYNMYYLKFCKQHENVISHTHCDGIRQNWSDQCLT